MTASPPPPSAHGPAAGGSPSLPPAAGAPHAQSPWNSTSADPGGGPAQGPQPGTDLGADLGAALRFMGTGLWRNLLTAIVASLIWLVVAVVVGVAGGIGLSLVGIGGMSPDGVLSGGASVTIIVLAVVIALVSLVVGLLWQSGAARLAGVVRDGGRPSIGQALVGPGRVILTALLVSVIMAVGYVLLIIPGIIATVLLFFAIPAAVRGASPLAAIRESARLVVKKPGTSILGWLILSVGGSVASSLVLPVLVIVPLYALFQLGLFERLSGRELPEPARA